MLQLQQSTYLQRELYEYLNDNFYSALLHSAYECFPRLHSNNPIKVVWEFDSTWIYKITKSEQYCIDRFSDIHGFNVKNWLYIYGLKYWRTNSTLKKTVHLLRRSTYRSNFWFLHNNVNANQLGRAPLIETSIQR